MLYGSICLLLDDGISVTQVTFGQGQTVIVPRGVWHRGMVDRPCRMLALTYGNFTMHQSA